MKSLAACHAPSIDQLCKKTYSGVEIVARVEMYDLKHALEREPPAEAGSTST